MSRILLGLSGGVDSAVSAWLLQRQGHEVEGLFMFNWSEDEAAYCEAAEDFAAAQQVCAELDIPLHRADFSQAYRERVFAHFLDEYAAGRTPNPDLLCNREIKFGEFAAHARTLGADAIATGHYARLRQDSDGPMLCLAEDQNKDQTYFLAAVPRKALVDVIFPLGALYKGEVRRIAASAGLPNHARRDSTGICFIGERPMREFLGSYLQARPGPIVDAHGHRLGEHQGLAYYTLGQRRGLGIGGVAGGVEAPWYVLRKDLVANRLVVTQDRNDPGLYAQRLEGRVINWLRAPESAGQECQARIRHRQPLQAARVEVLGDTANLSFAQPQWAAAPGQYAVVYDGEDCLGCLVIDRTWQPGPSG